LSVDDLLKVMGTLRRKGTIMSTAKAQNMLDSGFGLDVVSDTPAGRLYNKNGLWEDSIPRIEQSLAYFLPEDMEMAVLANSPIGTRENFSAVWSLISIWRIFNDGDRSEAQQRTTNVNG